jgi:DNA polymerase III alpha subunit
VLDGIEYPEKYIKMVKERGGECVGISDHGTMSGTFDFYTQAVKQGVKPLLGAEFYFVDDINIKSKETENRSHILLIAKNMEGYRALLKSVYRSNTEGFYSKPRIDWTDLQNFSGNVICSTACSGGIVAKNLENNPDGIIERLKDIFHDDLFMEYVALERIEYYKPIWQRLNELAEKHNIKSVITCDVHYPHRNDWKLQQILHNINNNVTIEEMKSNAGKGWQMSDKDLYLKSYDEIVNIMKNVFPVNKVEEYLANTLEVAHKVHKYSILPEHYVFPKVDFNVNEMKDKIRDNLKKKCPQDKIKIYQERVKYEWDVIEKMGFVPYFYIVADMIGWAKENGIRVGSARGSCSGSVITYLLDITEIDPIRFNLSFERFINPTRCLPPNMKAITPYGFKSIRDINIGDKVRSLSGKYNLVVAKEINHINKSIMEIEYDGGKIQCTKEHKWEINRNGKAIKVSAEELTVTDKLLGENDNLVDIVTISEIKYEGDVIDIEVQHEHNFFVVEKEENIPVCTQNSKMPDIDTDFQASKRQQVLSYLKKYGEENVAQIGSYGTYKEKNTFKDIARIYGMSAEDANYVTKAMQLDDKGKVKMPTVGEAVNAIVRGRMAVGVEVNDKEKEKLNEVCKNTINYSAQIVGNIKNYSQHAAGVVITDKPIYDYVPTIRLSSGLIATGIDGDTLTKHKFVKMDILGLLAMDIIDDCINMVKECDHKNVDINNIELNDDNMLEMFRNRDVESIFQFDTWAMKNEGGFNNPSGGLLKRVQPDKFKHLVELNAINRPGPLSAGMDKLYEQRRFGTKYITPKLIDKHLKETYGLLIYQEQVMSIMSEWLGVTMGEADNIRREMEGKSLRDILNERNGYHLLYSKYDKKDVEEAVEFVQGAAGYLFCQGHSLSYSYLAMQMMYFKCYYRKYFNVAVLNNEKDEDKLNAIKNDCKCRGWLKEYNLNELSYKFDIDSKNGKIIPGLKVLKGLGEKSVVEIIKHKPYTSIDDFFVRAKPSKKVLEILQNNGAFKNTFGIDINVEQLMDKKSSKKQNIQLEQLF